MSGFPLQSVLIPVYNHSSYVLECLDSVATQTYTNLELIIIDDGSTDDSAEVVKAFLHNNQQRFARVEFRSRPNKGVSPTLNEGLQLCRGDWVHILASDDSWMPDKVMQQWRAYLSCQEESVALIVADVDCVDDSGQVIVAGRESCLAPGVNTEAYRILLQANAINAPTAVIRRTALCSIGGFDESLAMEDWDCWLRISAGHSILRVPKALARYRYHGQNSHKKNAVMLEALLRTFAKFMRENGNLLTLAEHKKCWRKNRQRIYRWAKGADKALLLKIFIDYVSSPLKKTGCEDYEFYADKIKAQL